MTADDLAREINKIRQQVINLNATLWFLENLEKQLTQDLEAKTGKPIREVRPA